MTKRFGQVKRYGLEGLEAMLVAVDEIIASGGPVVIGMAHRGRLNLLLLLLGYPLEALFHKLSGRSEFDGAKEPYLVGDVLSHLAHAKSTASGAEIRLLPNSSHLEAVNPVALGYARATGAMPLQIHGDAAVCGQGVIQECLQLSQLAHFSTRGSLHLICNNQLGFTTNPDQGRSTEYASGVMKMVEAPIWHVSAQAPEHVAWVTKMAMAYRERFGKDACIDLIGWRQWGHNELDEPAFTQPDMYRRIRMCVAQDNEEAVQAKAEYARRLEEAMGRPAPVPPAALPPLAASRQWSAGQLREFGLQSVAVPEGFRVHPRLQKHHIEARREAIERDAVDWATAEAIALATLLQEGQRVRLCGQDVARGTFSQRHLHLVDQETEAVHAPLAGLEVVNSPLSEMAVMGFEYGCSLAGWRTIWEAQFGDFFNGAQVIIDAFLTSGLHKWRMPCGMALLLPHGYDGAGPEHSSCRIERWLQLSCESGEEPNLAVIQPTTPASLYHALRQPRRHPLIVASAKTLLRLPAAVSSLKDLSEGRFQPVLASGPKDSPVAVLCSGKVFYELQEALPSAQIIRLEQLCPLPLAQLKATMSGKAKRTPPKQQHACVGFVWVQEEPANQGAWPWIKDRLQETLPARLEYVGRPSAPCPATGVSAVHKAECADLAKAVHAIQ